MLAGFCTPLVIRRAKAALLPSVHLSADITTTAILE
jgi:hypothetical protein